MSEHLNEQPKEIKIDRQTPDPEIYKEAREYIPVNPIKDIKSIRDVSKFGSRYDLDNFTIQPKKILVELQAVISELELSGDINNVAVQYNPMRPRSWGRAIVVGVGSEIDFCKVGDEVQLSELNRLEHVDIPNNKHCMANVHTSIKKRERDLQVSSDYKGSRYYLIKEYISCNIDAVLGKATNVKYDS